MRDVIFRDDALRMFEEMAYNSIYGNAYEQRGTTIDEMIQVLLCVPSAFDVIENGTPRGGYIPRELALSHPFANGDYDAEHADRDFIRGFESYKEWLERLPVSFFPGYGELRSGGKEEDMNEDH